MQWRDVAETVGGMAPLLGSALGGQAGNAVGKLAARALGVEATPDAVRDALGDPEAALKLQRLENEHEQALTRMVLEAENARLAEVNQTMRAEAASCDPFVRRWRPTFGYLTALAWLLQGIAIAWSIIASPEQAGIVAQAITALTPMWGIALAILGVNASCRSKDKQVAAGQRPAGFMDAVATRISR